MSRGPTTSDFSHAAGAPRECSVNDVGESLVNLAIF